MQPASAGTDPPTTLEGIQAALAVSNPALYRHIALYLQVLRTVLPQRVQQAVFHLATQVHGQRYLALSDDERRALHVHLQDLLSRCSSLLTVEQLSVLASRLLREDQQRQAERQQELLQRLLSRSDDDASEDEEVAPPHPGLQAGRSDLPPGSVRLDFSLPLAGGGFSWSPIPFQAGSDSPSADRAMGDPLASELDAFGADGDAAESDAIDAADLHDGDDVDEEDGEPEDRAQDAQRDAVASELSDSLLQEAFLEEGAMRALFDPVALASLFAHGDPLGTGESRESASSASADPVAPGRRQAGAGLPFPLPPHPAAMGDAGHETLLPRDPVQLLQWLDGLERALVRRLRNLSHAINVDLLRFGLSRGLLPVSLLDAVLQGQVETLASPANVLRLQLPFGLRPGSPPLQALAVLLRPVDLEMEEPRLRTCRRRLQQQRQELRRMAQQYRRLQRRLQAREAERLWLQDIHRSRRPID